MTDTLKKWVGKTVQDRVENLLLLLLAVYLFGLSIYSSNYQFPLAEEFMLLFYVTAAVAAVRIILLRPWNRRLVFALVTAV